MPVNFAAIRPAYEDQAAHVLKSRYVERSGDLVDAPGLNPLADFIALRCFVANARQSFKPGFADPVGEALGRLGASISK